MQPIAETLTSASTTRYLISLCAVGLACSTSADPAVKRIEAQELVAAVAADPTVKDVLGKLEARGCGIDLEAYETPVLDDDGSDDTFIVQATAECAGAATELLVASGLFAVVDRSLTVTFVSGTISGLAESADEFNPLGYRLHDFVGFLTAEDGTVVEEGYLGWIHGIASSAGLAASSRIVDEVMRADQCAPGNTDCHACQAAHLTGVTNAWMTGCATVGVFSVASAGALGAKACVAGPKGCIAGAIPAGLAYLGCPQSSPLGPDLWADAHHALNAHHLQRDCALEDGDWKRFPGWSHRTEPPCPAEPECYGSVSLPFTPGCRPLIGGWGDYPHCVLDDEGVFACCRDYCGLHGEDCSSTYKAVE